MNGADDSILEQAADWHIASVRDDMDWDGFTRWLEADARHRQAYDEVAQTVAAIDAHRFALASTVPVDEAVARPARPVRKRSVWIGGALAASLAALLVVPRLTTPEPRTFASGDGLETIALADGSQVVLGPHSRLTVAGRHGERLALDGGAYFTIAHDPSRRMTISAGKLEIGDIGTRFEVQADGDAVRVEVSEGKVELRGEALDAPVVLTAGRGILFDPSQKLATVAPVAGRDVGEWREGRLTYDAAPLSLVAADLARYAGVTVTVPPPLAGRRFSGTLSIHDGDSAVRDLAQLMGLELSRRGSAYRLSTHG